jgi:hypothetical protein
LHRWFSSCTRVLVFGGRGGTGIVVGGVRWMWCSLHGGEIAAGVIWCVVWVLEAVVVIRRRYWWWWDDVAWWGVGMLTCRIWRCQCIVDVVRI